MNQSAADDPFCEGRMWNDSRMAIYQPIGATTGALMMAVALVNNVVVMDSSKKEVRMPRFLIICKAALVLVAVGTTVYHATRPSTLAAAHLNHGLADWAPIVLMCTNILMLYLFQLLKIVGWVKGERGAVVVFAVVLAWAFVLIMAIDSDTNSYFTQRQGDYGALINALLLVPLAIVLIWALVGYVEWRHSKWLAASLLVTATLWLISNYGCEKWPPLSVLHSVYHLTIAYAFMYAACLGVCLDGEDWQFSLECHYWPQIISTQEANKVFFGYSEAAARDDQELLLFA